MILKEKYLNKKVKNAIKIAYILLDEEEISISKIAQIIYELYKINIDNKKLLKELLSNISRTIEKSLKELIALIITLNLIRRIKNT